jgi:serine/threonine protein kinase/formylglycine-generating enzyme required for sulfatase activity
MNTLDDLSFARAAVQLGLASRSRLLQAASDCLEDASLSIERALVRRGVLTEAQAAEVRRASSGGESTVAPERCGGPAEASAGAPDRYRLVKEIGRGGLGRVVHAHDTALEREVAVKLVLGDVAPDVAARFMREARITARLDHPNVVPVYDAGTREGPGGAKELFLCMKRIHGRDLAEVLAELAAGRPEAKERWSRVRLLQIFQDICLGVAYAHSKGVIHRDLKPSNVMIGEFGEVLVVDWGLAKELGAPAASPSVPEAAPARPAPQASDPGATVRVAISRHWREEVAAPAEAGDPPELTFVGDIIGTPAYMSPEQASGRTWEVDARSDIYALGAILYEILTLHPPAEGASVAEILDKVRSGRIDPPSKVVRGTPWPQAAGAAVPGGPAGARSGPVPMAAVPSELESVCLRALALRREDRYGSALEIHRDIQLFIEGVRERERERRLAEEAFALVMPALDRHARLARDIEEARLEVMRLYPTDAGADRNAYWAAEDRVRSLEAEGAAAMAEAEDALTSALGHDPSHEESRRIRASLAWRRFLEAEARGDRTQMVLLSREVERFDDGAYAELLRGDGSLAVRARSWACACMRSGRDVGPDEFRQAGYHLLSGRYLQGGPGTGGLRALEPDRPARLRVHGPSCQRLPVEGADVWLWEFREEGRLLMPASPRTLPPRPGPPAPLDEVYAPGSPYRPRVPGAWLGRTPVGPLRLPMGSYLAIVRREGYLAARVPVFVDRGAVVVQDVTLYRRDEMPPGMLPIVEGEFTSGGDREGTLSEEPRRLAVDEFLLSRDPVTCAEYAAFLNDLAARSAEEAHARAPRASAGGASCWPGPPYAIPDSAWLASAPPELRACAHRLGGSAEDWRSDWPVFYVTFHDALAYAAWVRARDGFLYTLPAAVMREKAVRGPDRRIFSCGSTFDPRWFRTSLGRPEERSPAGVAEILWDESPYGVRGLCGNSRDLCLSVASTHQTGWRTSKGGMWNNNEPYCRSTNRMGTPPDSRNSAIGFRLYAETLLGPPDPDPGAP